MKHTESDLGDGEDVPLVPDEVPHTLQSGRPDRLAGGGERNPQTHEDLPHPHPVVGALPPTLRLLQQPGEGLQVVDLKSDGQTDSTISPQTPAGGCPRTFFPSLGPECRRQMFTRTSLTFSATVFFPSRTTFSLRPGTNHLYSHKVQIMFCKAFYQNLIIIRKSDLENLSV